MPSTSTAAAHRKYVVNLSRNVYLTVADLLVEFPKVEETVLLVIAFTMGGVISFDWG